MSKAASPQRLGPTPDQARASSPHSSAWVSANAGSGKTFVLVQRVLRLLLAGTDPGKILCLTFTRAAAAEMSNRVFARLAAWAGAEDDVLAAMIAEIDGHRPDAARLAFARTLFARALETPGGLKIQTIHAFCERLLHQFAFEANVPAHFQVMDEAASAELRSRAQAQLLGQDRLPPALDEALDELISHAGEQRFADLIRALIGRRAALRDWLCAHENLDAALAALRRQFDLSEEDTLDQVEADWLCSSILPQSEWTALADLLLASKSSSDRQRGEALALASRAVGAQERRIAYQSFLLTADGTVRKSIMTKALREANPDPADRLEREMQRAGALVLRQRALEIFAASAALIRLGNAVIDGYEAHKRRVGLLDYDDLIGRVLDLLSRAQAAPWVLFKLDGGIDHILIDEAQDTNPDQWRIIQILAEEALAGMGARNLNRSIFAVGDEKQSIYSFQGAQPAAFERMHRFFARRVREVEKGWEGVNLIMSFRSVPIVLQAVDAVFMPAHARRALSELAAPVVHTALREHDPGLVEVWPVERPAPGDEKSAWHVPLDRPEPDHPRLRLAERIAAKVAALVAGDVIVEKGERRIITPGDILILVRKRNELVDAMISALRRRDIPVAGADRLVLSDHIAVQDLMAAGDVALLPEDDLVLASLLKSPLIGFDDDALFELAHGRGGTLWAALSARREEAAFAQAFARISAWRARADFERPYEFFAHILGPDGGRLRLIARLGPEAADAIDEFLNLALAYEETRIASLQGFLHWMRAQSVDIKRNMEEGRGEVRIMTIHGAKGLEAPVVFLADTCDLPGKGLLGPLLRIDASEQEETGALVWSLGKSDTAPAPVQAALERDHAAQLAEYHRLLYVAMTRARDRLYVCGALGGRVKEPPDGCWYAQIATALEPLATGIDDGAGGSILRLGDVPMPQAGAAFDTVQNVPSTDRPNWLDWPAAPPPTSAKTLLPSSVGDEETARAYTGEGAERARARGTFVHRLLELLPDLPASERPAAAARLGHLLLTGFSEPERNLFIGEALALLADRRLAPLFAPSSLAEISIAGLIATGAAGDTQAMLSGQIDRLAIDGDQVLIADYKTNRLAPASPDDVPAAYIAQLSAYRRALLPLFPDKHLRFFLIWTVDASVMEIDQALLMQ